MDALRAGESGEDHRQVLGRRRPGRGAGLQVPEGRAAVHAGRDEAPARHAEGRRHADGRVGRRAGDGQQARHNQRLHGPQGQEHEESERQRGHAAYVLLDVPVLPHGALLALAVERVHAGLHGVHRGVGSRVILDPFVKDWSGWLVVT
ncbi:Protein kinase superfamily protein [Zea mays]|jgi:hypothetical protein|uniref:Protein kinase superfamily protein n=1 Tax=Zea mays TaxID=4577 RepID=A0A1D6QSK3_MAIZE|nr:Protein kinase superfamily protein [Zea mays]